MSEEPVVDTKTNERENRSQLYEITRKIMLAAIGAAAIATEELDGFLTRMAERGELAEKDAQKLAAEMKEKRASIIEERRANVTQRHATRADIETLSARVAELTRQVEELKAAQRRPGEGM